MCYQCSKRGNELGYSIFVYLFMTEMEKEIPTLVHFEMSSDDIFAKGFVKDDFMKTTEQALNRIT